MFLLIVACGAASQPLEQIPQVAGWSPGTVALSPDGRLLAATSGRQAVSLYDVDTGLLFRRLSCPEREVAEVPEGLVLDTGETKTVTFSPDGRYVASTRADWQDRRSLVATGTRVFVPCLWEVASGQDARAETLRYIETTTGPRVEGFPFELREPVLWQVIRDSEVAKRLARYRGPASVFSPNGLLGASVVAEGDASEETTIQIWDLASGQLRHSLRGHERTIIKLQFSPDGKWLVSHGWDDELLVWDLETGGQAPSPPTGDDDIRDVRFTADSSHLAVSGDSVQVFETDGWKLVFQKPLGRSYETAIAFSDDGRRLAAVVRDETIVWSTESWEQVGALDPLGLLPVTSLRFSPDDRSLAVGTMEGTFGYFPTGPNEGVSGLVVVWSLVSTDPPRRLREDMIVEDVDFSPDGRYLATASQESVDDPRLLGLVDGQLRIWDLSAEADASTQPLLTTGDADTSWRPALAELEDPGATLRVEPESSATAVRFAPDGKALYTVVDRLYAETGEEITTQEFESNAMLMAWDLQVGEWRYAIDTGPGRLALAMDSQGERLATGRDRVTVRDAGTGEEVWTSGDSRGMVATLAFSPDGKRLASGGWDGSLTVHHLEASSPEAHRVEAHQEPLLALAIHPHDETIATGSCTTVGSADPRDPDARGTLRLWSIATVSMRRELAKTCVTALRFSNDGRWLAAGGKDGIVTLWRTADWTHLLSLAILPNSNAWLLWTPDGRYDGNDQGKRRILGIRRGRSAEPLPVSLHQRGLLKQILDP